MISIDEIKRIAWLKGIRSAGNAEKDYLLDIALLSVSRSTKDELVFKGGTCMSKFYKLDRFSEDLDFTLRKELNTDSLLEKICSSLTSFGIESTIKDKRSAYNSVMATIRTKGPLYRNTPMSLSNIGVDINLKSSIDMEPVLSRYSSLYPDIPPFSILIMQELEILAEKMRAAMSRAQARDLYDIWFLLSKGVKLDQALVKRKLEYYGKEWNPKEFIRSLDSQKAAWRTELGPLVEKVPDFRDVRKLILENIS
jgi:predicted nucleotidyltransferase component of viral defense system